MTPADRARPRAVRLVTAVSLLVVVLLVTLLGPGLAAASAAALTTPSTSASASPSTPAPARPLFGAVLDWTSDSAASYTSRLGRSPALYGQTAPFPPGSAELGYLSQFYDQVAAQGARALLTVEPRTPIEAVDDAAADALARQVADYQRRFGVQTYLRFAPEMNAPWRAWGQQPQAFITAFRRVAAAVHRLAPGTVMVWSPTFGAGYPFRAPAAATSPATRILDTDRDGRLDIRDDAYGPYYPGDDAVDWVGLPLYFWGRQQPWGANALPEPGQFAALLRGGYGYVGPDRRTRDFYQRFAVARKRPMLVETGALFNPARGGPASADIKTAWWRQVFSTVTSAPSAGRVGSVVWQEVQRPEPAADGATIDWRATTPAGLARSLAADLERSGLTLATRPDARTTPSSPPAVGGHVLRGGTAWALASLVLALGLGLLALGLTGQPAAWAYRETGARDLRIDMIRGIAIVFVVVDHINIPSLFHLLSQEAIGPISGAELFVGLSGVVVGLVYRPRLERAHLSESVAALWRRAGKLYVTALAVVLAVWLAGLLPGVDARVLTTFTEQTASGRGGRVYDLYANIQRLADYPIPGFVLRDILSLRLGPQQFNVMGLYVILLLVTPVLLWVMRRRLSLLVLLLSWGLYVLNAVRPVRILPSAFEDPFPLLTWQLLFVMGLVAGYHRAALLSWARRPAGRVGVAAAVVTCLALLIFSWSNPTLSNPYEVRLSLLPDHVFTDVYDHYFRRTQLDIGRVAAVVVLVITLYAAFSAFWVPLRRGLGRFLVPLGQATLYVFVMHVLFVLVVGNVPALNRGHIVLNTAAHAVVLALLWLMVRRRFLFGVVPR
jgi:hypothetical protein